MQVTHDGAAEHRRPEFFGFRISNFPTPGAYTMVRKPERSHKSKAERKRLAKSSKVKVVGDGGFVQRTARPKKQGKNVKSAMIRVDAGFAAWCRKRARTEGSVTEVTRQLHQRIQQAEIDVAGKVLEAAVAP